MKITEYGQSGKNIFVIPRIFMSEQCMDELISFMPDHHFVCVTLDGHYADCDEYENMEKEVDKLVNSDRGLSPVRILSTRIHCNTNKCVLQ